MLRSQIQASEAIRQTQAIEHICITADPKRDYPLLRLNVFNKPKYFDNLASAVALNNELEKKLFPHQSSVIGHRSLVTNLVIYHQSLEKQVTDFNLKN